MDGDCDDQQQDPPPTRALKSQTRLAVDLDKSLELHGQLIMLVKYNDPNWKFGLDRVGLPHVLVLVFNLVHLLGWMGIILRLLSLFS